MTSSTTEDCLEMQQDEILALDSIYNNQSLDIAIDRTFSEETSNTRPSMVVESNIQGSSPTLRFTLPIVLPRPIRIRITSTWPSQPAASSPPEVAPQKTAKQVTPTLRPTADTFQPKMRPLNDAPDQTGPSGLEAGLDRIHLDTGKSRGPSAALDGAPHSATGNTGPESISAKTRGSSRSRGSRGRGTPRGGAAMSNRTVLRGPDGISDGKSKGRRRRKPQQGDARQDDEATRATTAGQAGTIPSEPARPLATPRPTDRVSTTSATEGAQVFLANDSPALLPTSDAASCMASARPPRIQKLPPLSHLPPVILKVRLPPKYPLRAAPQIIALEAAWLPASPTGISSNASSWIRKRLLEQYDELGGFEVLWVWGQWIAEGVWEELLASCADTDNSDLPFRAHEESSSIEKDTHCELSFDERLASNSDTPLLPATLLSHSRTCTRSDFAATLFACGICLEDRKGQKCTKLEGCGHVFCSECLVTYLSMLVDEGFQRQAKRCPDPECVKMRGVMEKRGEDPDVVAEAKGEAAVNCSTGNDATQPAAVRGSISRHELSTILTPDQLSRLDRLTVKAAMESDPSITYCPRSGCQSAVIRKPGDEGIWERFRQCPECNFSFCAWCGRSWHGTNPCPVSFHADLVEKYRRLEEGSVEKRQMELSFGKSTLLKLVIKWEEEEKTKEWLKSYTTACPTCSICIEKSYGCNHMTCQSCRTHYCYLCGKSISATNPYLHFNTPGGSCFNRLFDNLLSGGAQLNEQGRPIEMDDFIPWEDIL